MIILAYDTTLACCSVALLDTAQDRILAAEQQAMEKGHAEAIAPMVQRVVAAAGLEPGQINRIAVTTGPGTFTGLRIGLSLAHGMGVALGCEVVGLDTLTATAAPLLDDVAALMVVHQAGATGKFYAGRFDGGTLSGALVFDEAATVLALAGNDGSVIIGTGADAILATDPAKGNRRSGHDLPCAEHFIRYAARLPAAADLPQPVYLREPDAKPKAGFAPETIRLAEADDIPALARLHQICFDQGWSEDSLRATLAAPGVTALVAARDGGIRAFLVLRTVADEAEILTLCTAPHWRRRALGGKLLQAARDLLRVQKIALWHLEVAADNAAARALYEAHGFAVTGRRKGYYTRPGAQPCDAILMSCTP